MKEEIRDSKYYYKLANSLPNDGTCFSAIMNLTYQGNKLALIEKGFVPGSKFKVIKSKYGGIYMRDFWSDGEVYKDGDIIEIMNPLSFDLKWNSIYVRRIGDQLGRKIDMQNLEKI